MSLNSTPIDEAVHLNTEFEEGSNEPHDLALALQFMTVRWLGASYEPDSPWVFVAFKTPDGRTLECKFLWSMFVQKGGPRIIVTDHARGHRVWHRVRGIPTWSGRCMFRQVRSHSWRKKVFAAAKPDDRPTQEKLNKVAEHQTLHRVRWSTRVAQFHKGPRRAAEKDP